MFLAASNAAGSVFLRNGAPPTLVSSSPADNATGIAPGANISLTFSEAIFSGGGSIQIVRTSDNVVVETIATNSARVTGLGTATVTIDPVNDLAPGVGYHIRFDANAFRDADGNNFARYTPDFRVQRGIDDPNFLNFTTIANTPPALAGTPANPTILDTATATPFSALSFTDAESNGGTITITFTAANGALSGTGLTGSAGNYTLSGANPTELTARLQALVFTPTRDQVAPGSNVVTTFTLTPNDGSANGSAVTAQVTATSVNDAPVLGGLPGTPVGVFDNATVSPFANATIADPDTGQTIVVTVALDDAAKGTLAGGGFVHQGGGVYTFSAASAAAAETALRALVFTPAANRVAGGATETTTFSVTVSDGTAQASGSAQVVATGVNDAPTLTPGSVVVMIGTDENDTWPTGTLVSALLAGAGYADADPGAFAGIAVTAQTIVGSGTWFYSPNGGATWINIASVSSTSSLLLASTAQLRFVPDGVVGGTATLTFRAWDGTTGTASDTISRFADTTTNGGSTAFSAAVATATKVILDVNDPPTLAATGTNPTFTEGDPAVALFSGVTISTIEPGETIVALTLTVSGLADGAAERLLIGGQALALTHGTTLALTGGGTASVSVAGGVATVSLTGLSRTPAEAQTLVESLAYENTSDDPTVAGGRTVTLISIRDSGGTANGGQDTTSVTFASAVTLEAVNDAPSLGQTSFALPPTDEITTAVTSVFAITTGLGFADPDGPGRGVAVIGSTGLGTWQFSTDAGDTWNSLGFVGPGNALLLSDAVQIRYVPNGTQGETATLTVRGWDRSSGVVGDRVDATTVGTATTFSTQVGTATLVVAAINDPPVLTGTVGGTFTETVANAGATPSGASVLLVSSDATVTDPDQPATFPGATLTVSFAVYQTGDRISFAATFGPYTYDSGTGEIRVGGTAVASVAGGVGGALVVTFTGAATNAVVTDVLRNVLYFHVGDDPTAGGTATTRAVSVVFNDGGNTGSGGPLSSDALTGDLTLVALNDPEGFAGTIAPTFAEGALPVPLAPGATVTRVDAASFDGGSLTVALGSYRAGDVLSISESGGITVSGGVVSFGGARIGTVTGGTGADLVVSFDRAEASHAAVQALVRAIAFQNTTQNPTDFGAATSRAVTMTLDDGGNSGAAGSATSTLTGTIAIAAVDTPPSVTPSAGDAAFEPNGGAITIDPGLVVADPDSLTLVQAIVTLPVSPDNSSEVLGLTPEGISAMHNAGLTASYLSATRTLTITGSASVEVYQTILRNVTYRNTSGMPDVTPRDVTFSVRDASGLDSVVATRTVLIANTIAPTFQEGGAPLLLSPATFLSATGLTFDGGSVTAAFTAYAPGDVLSIREIGGITVVGGVVFFEGARIGTVSGGVGAALVVSLDRPEATRDAVQALGRAIAFQNATANPTDFGNAPNRAVTLTIVGSDPSQDRTIAGTLAIVAVNDAPVVTPSAGDASFTIGGGRIVVDPGIVVADVDSVNLNRAVVVLAATPNANLEVLGFTDAGLDALVAAGLSANYSAGTRALTISGIASVEVYQTILRNVTYGNSASAPDTTPRTLTFTVRDAAGLESAGVQRSIVLVDNVLPVVTIGTLPSVAEGGSVILTPAMVTATDVETTDPAQLVFTITALSNGIVRLDGTALAVGGTFTQADVNAGRVTYLHDASETTTGGFSFTVRDADNGTSGAQTLAFAITPVNDAPTISVAGVLTAPEDVPTALVGISFADPDAGSSPVFVTLSVARGTLIATSGSGVTVAGSGTGAITLLGSVADINAFVAASGVTFLTAQDDDQNVALTITIDDLGNTGSGGAQSATATVTIIVDPVNDAPVIGGVTPTPSPLEAGTGPAPIAPLAAITIADLDTPVFVGGRIEVVQTSGIANGTFSRGGAAFSAGDTVLVGGVAIGTVAAGFDGRDGAALRIDLGVGATHARVEAFLRTLDYAAPTGAGDRAFLLTLVDGDDPGVHGADTATAAFTIAVAPSVPAVAGLTGAFTYLEKSGPVLLGTAVPGAVLVTDLDSPSFDGGELRIAITGGVATEDRLAFLEIGGVSIAGGTLSVGGVAVGTVTGGSGGADLVVALAAGANPARITALLSALAYENLNQANPVEGARTVSITLRDAAPGPFARTSDPAQIVLTVEGVNDAPVIGGVDPAPQAIDDRATAQPFATATIADADGAGVTLTTIVTIAQPAQGSFAPASLGGFVDLGGGVYRFVGTQADAQAALRGLVFVPTENRVAPGSTDTTTLQVSVSDGIAAPVTASATIVATSINDAPTLAPLPSVQVLNDKSTLAPFAGAAIVDPDVGQPLTVTVTIGQPGQGGFTAASLAASGFAATGVPGVFALVAPDAAAAQAALRALVFQPVENRILPGTTETMTFTVSVSDGVAPAVERVASVVVTSINDAPVVGGLPPGQSVAHDGTLQPFAGMLVADPDAGQTLSVRIAIGNPGTGGLTAASLAAAGFVEIAPGLYERNDFANPDAAAAALRGLVFQPVANAVPPGASASIAITVTVSDGTAAATSTGTVTIVGPQLQAPIPPPPPPVVPPAPPPAPPPVAPPPIIFVPGPPIGGPVQIPTFGGAVVSILAPDRGGPVAAPSFSPISATSGFFLAPSDGAGLGIAIRASTPVGDFVMRSGGGSASFTLPPATFVVESAGAQVLVGALLADGSPLPAWVQFDPATGTFRVDVPPGFTGTLDIVLTARLATGESASTGFRIAVDAESEPPAPQEAPAQGAPTQQAPTQEAPPQREGAAPAPEPVRLVAEGGKPAFSDAVKAASRGAWATQGQSFLDDLIATLPGGRPSGEIEGDSRNGRDAA